MTQENVNQNEKRTTQNGRRTTTKSNYKTEKRKTEEAYGKTTKMEEKGARNTKTTRNTRKNTRSIRDIEERDDGNNTNTRNSKERNGVRKARNSKAQKDTLQVSNNQDIFKKSKLKIIPLGGLHEVGKNITVFEYEDEIIIVDCGLSFPEDDMLGIDLVIPDVSYLEKNQEKIKGMIITHGHEDQI